MGCFFLSISYSGYGQRRGLQNKTIVINGTVSLDSFPINDSSIRIFKNDQELRLSDFQIDFFKATISSKKYNLDTLTLRYQQFPIPRKIYARSLFETKASTSSAMDYNPDYASRYLSIDANESEGDDIQYTGSFVRGITVGNNQSSAINSGFNLNLGGRLRSGLEITANLTDANIPIQPDGNSASIQEFDKIFIQFKKDSHKAIIGDFDITEISPSHLLKMDRKLQGIHYEMKAPINNKLNLKVGGTAAVTRGLFARNTPSAIENNQGPYKLFGNNGEAFIIIIAGTERVFVNGELMKRGIENDYVINYNIGEITFTARRMITQDLRIVVEFQYSDRNFFRYTLEGNASLEHKNWNIYSQVFTENDSKNSPINSKLTTAQLQRLAAIGNKIDSAYVSSENSENWDAARILYKKIDSTVAGITYPNVYVWSQNSRDTVVRVVFTLAGQGRGNYKLGATSANGAVYEWVAPIAGQMQGAYTPEILLSTPKTQLQAIVGSSIRWNQSQSTMVELSYTNNDLNTFSQVDDEKNNALGIILGHQVQHKIDSLRSLKFSVNQEYIGANFNPTTRFRNNEFQRDWSLNMPTRYDREQSITNLSSAFQSKYFNSKLSTNFYFIPNYFAGNQSTIEVSGTIKRMNYSMEHRLLNSSIADSNTFFYRPKGFISYSLAETNPVSVEVGFFNEMKRNSTKTISLTNNSFEWQNYYLSLKKNKGKHQFDFRYIYRTEAYADSSQFLAPQVLAHTFSLSGNSEIGSSQTLSYVLNYRNFNSSMANSTGEILHNYLGKMEHQVQLWRGMVRSNASYEVKAGREQRMQLTYIRAPNGYGNYAWKDLNNNGIFELNEAFVSPIITENTYMRFFIVLPEFIPANQASYAHLIWIQPKSIWYDQTDFRKFLSKFQYQLRLDMAKKIRTISDFGFIDYINPLGQFRDTSIVFSRSNIFQQLSFQKNEAKLGMDLEYIYSDAKNLLSNGIEGTSTMAIALKSRVELSSFLTLTGRYSTGHRHITSEFFTERNFKYVDNQIENTLSCILRQNMKINVNAIYGFRSTGTQYNIQQQGDLEFKMTRKNDGIIESKLSILNQFYEANTPNPQIELAMLNGIQRGVNYIWNLTVGQKLTKLFQLNVIYNGRKNMQSPNIIHSGNVEVRAVF